MLSFFCYFLRLLFYRCLATSTKVRWLWTRFTSKFERFACFYKRARMLLHLLNSTGSPIHLTSSHILTSSENVRLTWTNICWASFPKWNDAVGTYCGGLLVAAARVRRVLADIQLLDNCCSLHLNSDLNTCEVLYLILNLKFCKIIYFLRTYLCIFIYTNFHFTYFCNFTALFLSFPFIVQYFDDLCTKRPLICMPQNNGTRYPQ